MKDFLKNYIYFYKIPFIPKVYRKIFFKEYAYNTHENRDENKIYYVIRVNPIKKIGVFAYYRYVLGHILYCINNNYIPVVNMRDYKNVYIDWPNNSMVNSWETFFEQPAGIDLDYVMHCKNVIFSKPDDNEDGLLYNDYTAPRKYVKAIANKYIRFNDVVNKMIEEEYERVLKGKGRICGLKLRGSDYIISKFHKHAIIPEKQKEYDDIIDTLNSWGEKYDYIYLSTEDKSLIEYFTDRLGEKIIYRNINRYDADKIWYKSKKGYEERVQEGYDYCIDVGLLSKCDALITTVCQGAGAAVIINDDKYENIKVLDYGFY